MAAAVAPLHPQGQPREQQGVPGPVVATAAAAEKLPQAPPAVLLPAQQARSRLTPQQRRSQEQQQQQHQTAEGQEGLSCASAMTAARRCSWRWQHHPASGGHPQVPGQQLTEAACIPCLQGSLRPAMPPQHLQQMPLQVLQVQVQVGLMEAVALLEVGGLAGPTGTSSRSRRTTTEMPTVRRRYCPRGPPCTATHRR